MIPSGSADDLFASSDQDSRRVQVLGTNALVLRGLALGSASEVLADLEDRNGSAPYRTMETPGRFRMSVETTSFGSVGWTSDRAGYRYAALDPRSGKPWPPLPASFKRLARVAAACAGFPEFAPDTCLVNRYRPGAKMSLHQDRNERDFTAPIVSISLGLPATFLWGGEVRSGSAERILLVHGDVVVWGGPDRLRFHGILPVKPGIHPVTGNCRINLTFRKAL